jgi:hypothetical protein
MNYERYDFTMNYEIYDYIMKTSTVSEKIAFKNMRQNAPEVEKNALDSMVMDRCSTDAENEIVTKMFINCNIFFDAINRN